MDTEHSDCLKIYDEEGHLVTVKQEKVDLSDFPVKVKMESSDVTNVKKENGGFISVKKEPNVEQILVKEELDDEVVVVSNSNIDTKDSIVKTETTRRSPVVVRRSNSSRTRSKKKNKVGKKKNKVAKKSFSRRSNSVWTTTRSVKTELAPEESQSKPIIRFVLKDNLYSALKPPAQSEETLVSPSQVVDLSVDVRVRTSDNFFFDVHSFLLFNMSSVLKDLIVEKKRLSNDKITLIQLDFITKEDFELLLTLIYDGTVSCDAQRLHALCSLLKIENYTDASMVSEGSREADVSHALKTLAKGGVIKTEDNGGKCLSCGTTFSRYSNGIMHFERVHNVGGQSLKCPMCAKVCGNRVRLMDHLRHTHDIRQKDLMGIKAEKGV